MTAPSMSCVPGSTRIFVFDEVYPFRAAQEQAEKKKLSAFGLLAKINLRRRPTPDTVQLTKEELRYEPFWHITATRSIDYCSQATYQVPVHNAYAQQLQIEGLRFDVARQKDKARIEFVAVEQCHRKISYDEYLDGMQRGVAPSVLAGYVKRYKFTEHEEYENPALLKPALPLQAATDLAMARLSSEVVTAHEVMRNDFEFERRHLYARPVFAFEYRWGPADKTGVIEVDGLTGEVVESGHWFDEKITQRFTRERLIDLGADAANLALPGSGIVIKAIGYGTTEAGRRP
ncbi:hypothetical protein [Pseudorhodoferax sp.]|uniref:hypothetical protein n=1 Tax=Pseudorhodoferax sp. TaxID=1993553 RepID=UPI0039E52FEE